MLEAVTAYVTRKGVQVVAKARDGEAALAAIRELRPRVALVDVGMPQLGGMQVAREASRTVPEMAVILYTGMAEREDLTEALDAGARGFLLKEAPLEDLMRAIETVATGDVYVDSVLAGVIATAETRNQSPRLTQREREVLRLLADGLRNEEIGKRLFISPETVRTHVARRWTSSTPTRAPRRSPRRSGST